MMCNTHFKSHLRSEPVHPYQLDGSISNFKCVLYTFSFLFYFEYIFLLANSEDPDQTPLGLYWFSLALLSYPRTVSTSIVESIPVNHVRQQTWTCEPYLRTGNQFHDKLKILWYGVRVNFSLKKELKPKFLVSCFVKLAPYYRSSYLIKCSLNCSLHSGLLFLWSGQLRITTFI